MDAARACLQAGHVMTTFEARPFVLLRVSVCVLVLCCTRLLKMDGALLVYAGDSYKEAQVWGVLLPCHKSQRVRQRVPDAACTPVCRACLPSPARKAPARKQARDRVAHTVMIL